MERNIRAPLTLPKHPELLERINQMNIDIKLSHLGIPEVMTTMIAAGKKIRRPSWIEVTELLMECYKAINEQREDPRKY